MIDAALLSRIHARAAEIDRTNSFPWEDLEDLKDAGYFTLMVPRDRGGAGLSLREMTQVQIELAAAAPATALAVNMHQVWMGVANTMVKRGNNRADFLFDAAMDGEIFAFGVSEPANDRVLMASDTNADPDGESGYRFTGTKVFTSLAPAYTMLGTFGTDFTDPDNPMSVFAFVNRKDGGITTKEDWDVLGMRASQSNSTILDGAWAPASQVLGVFPPGPTMEPVMFGIFANFEILLAAVYTGLAKRALELAVETVQTRQSRILNGPYKNDPLIRFRIAEAAIQLDSVYPHLEMIADDVDNLRDDKHGTFWYPRLSAIKSRATEVATLVVDEAIRASGGSSYFNSKELSRLYRDVLAGVFHPSDDGSLHNAWASVLLGPITA